MFIKEHVNKINSPTWVRINEDARKMIYREQFLQEYGGNFVKKGRYVSWEPKFDVSRIKDKYVVETPEGKVELIEIFAKFCRKHDLNKAAMYGTLSGVRNHHKGFKLLKVPE